MTRGSAEEETILPVVVVGLGDMGRLVAAQASRHPELRLVGVADPRFKGRSLSEFGEGLPDMEIAGSSQAVYARAKGGVALICTSSFLDEASLEIENAVRAGLHVVSSCEELSNAAFVDPEVAEGLERLAIRNGVGILGCGVNPGFVFDRLPATLGAVVGEVRRVEALRVVDLSTRRAALQHKLGVGLTARQFDEEAEEGTIGHIGLSESCALLADGLNLVVDEVEEELDPILAEAPFPFAGETLEAGRVRGVRQVARGMDEGREVIRLTLEIALGAEDPRDEIRIEGDPPLRLVIPGGIPGDRATAWALVNAAPRVAAAESGLLSVLDLPAGR